jgi:hypothetical protein
MQQERVSISELHAILSKETSMSSLLKSI